MIKNNIFLLDEIYLKYYGGTTCGHISTLYKTGQ